MLVDHRPAGTVLDTTALALLLGRSVETVRRWCGPGPHDAEQAANILLGAPDVVTVTAVQAQLYLGVSAGTVRSWASRGRLRAVGEAEGGPTYAVDQIRALREEGRSDARQ